MFAEIIAAQAFARSILGRFGFCKGNWFCHSVMHGSFWYWYPGVTAQVGLAEGSLQTRPSTLWTALRGCRERLDPSTAWVGQVKSPRTH